MASRSHARTSGDILIISGRVPKRMHRRTRSLLQTCPQTSKLPGGDETTGMAAVALGRSSERGRRGSRAVARRRVHDFNGAPAAGAAPARLADVRHLAAAVVLDLQAVPCAFRRAVERAAAIAFGN